MEEQLGIQKIMGVLQHRYPFLLVDRIKEYKYGEYVVAYKNISANEPWVQGHFPGNPIYPGAMIIESSAQAGGFLFFEEKNAEESKGGLLVNVEKFKFVKIVRPGDRIEIRVDLENKVGSFVKTKVKATVEGERVAEGVLTYVIGG